MAMILIVGITEGGRESRGVWASRCPCGVLGLATGCYCRDGPLPSPWCLGLCLFVARSRVFGM